MPNSKSKMSKWFAALSAVVIMALAGCQANTVGINPTLFAGLRVMDFAPTPAANVDVYWYQGTQTAEERARAGKPLAKVQANIHNLSYGGGAVYTDGIPAVAGGTKYHYVVTVVNSPDKVDTQGDITLFPGQNNTIVLTADSVGPNQANFSSFTMNDAHAAKVSNSADAKSTFVRLVNLQKGSGKIVLRLNNPTTGDVIGSVSGANGVDFGQYSDYYAIQTGKYEDTSYALFLTPANSTDVIARLSYQTYTPGSYFTIVYSGDPTRIPGELNKRTSQDSSQAGSDRIRLRVFPDDNIGADQTNPVDSAFRYNIINGVFIQGGYAPGINSMGFTINGDANPKRHGFTLWPVDMFGASGSNPHQLGDGSLDIHFMSTGIPSHPIDFVGGYVDANGASHNIFSKTDKNGIDESTIGADATVSFIVTNGNLDPRKAVTVSKVDLPSQVSADSVTLVFVNGISWPAGGSDPKSKFHLTSNSGMTYDSPLMTTGVKPDIESFNIADFGGPITIVDDIGPSGSKPLLNYDTVKFTPEAGGIYEIVSVGVRPEYNGGNKASNILVILTNRHEPNP